MPHPIRRRLHPLKTANHLFWKQECPKKGHAAPDPSPVAPPENVKPFNFKTRNPVFGTVLNDNIMITHSAKL
jgi:hypothetical protein